VPTVSEIALSLTGICTNVPPVATGICERCHGCPNPGFDMCWSCSHVESQLSQPCQLVVPISLYEIPSQLHHVLRHYKSGAYPDLTADFSAYVVSVLAHFLRRHGRCIARAAGGQWDLLTSVPSSRPRAGEHPLITSIGRVQSLGEKYEPLLELGSEEVGHLKASDNGFRVTRAVRGDRVLLIDDTFTTGATVQSAASALALAGAKVIAVVAIGRVINPHFSETVGDYWNRQRDPFTFDTCCLE
jgi:predicted amidophosphoribosyltransferase